MADSTEEFEPLFDYSRVQPFNVVCLDDDCPDSSPLLKPKRRKLPDSTVENVEMNGKVVHVIDSEEKEEDDWLPPPPKVSHEAREFGEDSTIKELRLKKQELAALAKEAQRSVDESVKIDFNSSSQPAAVSIADQPSKPHSERAKIVISIQEKDGVKQFRVYKDEKFERLFKMYADKSKLDIQRLVFSFDGDKISPSTTPDGLGMEDDDMIEVNIKSS